MMSAVSVHLQLNSMHKILTVLTMYFFSFFSPIVPNVQEFEKKSNLNNLQCLVRLEATSPLRLIPVFYAEVVTIK